MDAIITLISSLQRKKDLERILRAAQKCLFIPHLNACAFQVQE